MSIYEKIYAMVRSIPEVGYAMAALPDDTDVPWQRVINSKGQISMRKSSDGHYLQRILLEAEGIIFRDNDTIDLSTYRYRQ